MKIKNEGLWQAGPHGQLTEVLKAAGKCREGRAACRRNHLKHDDLGMFEPSASQYHYQCGVWEDDASIRAAMQSACLPGARLSKSCPRQTSSWPDQTLRTLERAFRCKVIIGSLMDGLAGWTVRIDAELRTKALGLIGSSQSRLDDAIQSSVWGTVQHLGLLQVWQCELITGSGSCAASAQVGDYKNNIVVDVGDSRQNLGAIMKIHQLCSAASMMTAVPHDVIMLQ
ncbi:hypothetical protein ABVT39_005428 [Epinephelus coioides]